MALGEKSCGKNLGTTCTEIKVGHFHQNTRKKLVKLRKNSVNNFIHLLRFLYKGVLFIMVMDSL